MNLRTVCLLHCCSLAALTAQDAIPARLGGVVPGTPAGVALWWAPSSAAKIRPDQAAPARTSPVMSLRTARNEREAVQLVIRCPKALEGFTITCAPLAGSGGAQIGSDQIEVLRAGYVQIEQPPPHARACGPIHCCLSPDH